MPRLADGVGERAQAGVGRHARRRRRPRRRRRRAAARSPGSSPARLDLARGVRPATGCGRWPGPAARPRACRAGLEQLALAPQDQRQSLHRVHRCSRRCPSRCSRSVLIGRGPTEPAAVRAERGSDQPSGHRRCTSGLSPDGPGSSGPWYLVPDRGRNAVRPRTDPSAVRPGSPRMTSRVPHAATPSRRTVTRTTWSPATSRWSATSSASHGPRSRPRQPRRPHLRRPHRAGAGRPVLRRRAGRPVRAVRRHPGPRRHPRRAARHRLGQPLGPPPGPRARRDPHPARRPRSAGSPSDAEVAARCGITAERGRRQRRRRGPRAGAVASRPSASTAVRRRRWPPTAPSPGAGRRARASASATSSRRSPSCPSGCASSSRATSSRSGRWPRSPTSSGSPSRGSPSCAPRRMVLLKDAMNSALDPDLVAPHARPEGCAARRRDAYFAAVAARHAAVARPARPWRTSGPPSARCVRTSA